MASDTSTNDTRSQAIGCFQLHGIAEAAGDVIPEGIDLAARAKVLEPVVQS